MAFSSAGRGRSLPAAGAVIVGTVVIIRRGGGQGQRGRPAAAVADAQPISTAPSEAESATKRGPAIGAQTERASELRRQADAVMAARAVGPGGGVRRGAPAAPSCGSSADLERREQRLSDREERLDAETRSLEERSISSTSSRRS